jgi:hypothetical protein
MPYAFIGEIAKGIGDVAKVAAEGAAAGAAGAFAAAKVMGQAPNSSILVCCVWYGMLFIFLVDLLLMLKAILFKFHSIKRMI